MADEQKTIEILMKFGLADQSKAEAAAAALKKIEKSAGDAKRRVAELRESMEKLQQVGATMTATGGAILAPFILSANKYIQKVGDTEKQSTRWLNSMDRMEQAQIRLGRATTSILNPALDQAAGLVEKMVGSLERNPKILETIIGLGSGLVGLGVAVSAVAQVGRTISSLQALQAAGGAAGMAGSAGMTLGTVALYASAVVIGAEAGSLIGNAIAEKIYGNGYQQQSIADAIVTAMKYVATPYVAAMKAFAVVTQKFGASVEWFDRGTHNLSTFIDGMGKLLNDMPFIGSNTAVNFGGGLGSATREAEQTSANERLAIVQDLASRLVTLEQSAAQQRSQAMAQFALQAQQAEANYYNQRQQAAASHNLQMLQMEQQHQLEMKRMAADHRERMDDLVSSRDALGMVKEKRRYERQRSEAEEQYRLQVQQQNAQFALQLQQMEQNYQLQQEQALQNFILQQQQREQQYQAERDAIQRQISAELEIKARGMAARISLESQYASAMISIGRQMLSSLPSTSPVVGGSVGSSSGGRTSGFTQQSLSGGRGTIGGSNSNITVVLQGDAMTARQVQQMVNKNNHGLAQGFASALQMAGGL